ncbi:hypothetical protein HQ590_07260 [bacterium]|nr:hypothetical protein [bacterium]
MYVDDVCDAIHAALTTDQGMGQTFFINADQAVTWKTFITTFAEMIRPPPVFLPVSSKTIRDDWDAHRPTLAANGRALVRLLASTEFHRQLGTIPALGATIRWCKRFLVRQLPPETVLRLKQRQSAAGPAAATIDLAMPNLPRVIRETNRVAFDNSLAKSALGWQPRYDLARGAALTRTWLEFARLLEREE